MTTAKLISIVQSMANNRKYFYSEADFQHSLALALQANGYDVFLEYAINGEHIDIIAKKNGNYYPIELKYRTKAFHCSGLYNNMCVLKDQNARDLGRYDYWEDVKRIEGLKNNYANNQRGFAIILTNDSEYWTAPPASRTNTIDRDFRIHKGMSVKNVFWNNVPEKAKNNPNYVTGNTTYAGFSLNKKYVVPAWQDYSTVKDSMNNSTQVFRFLTIEI